MRFVKKVIITGCEEWDEHALPYMTRWILLNTRFGKVMLHYFHRSDNERAVHDHPWWFISIILWRGYYEVTPVSRKRYWPGAIIFRRAVWQHRVELVNEKPAVSLVITGPRERTWGFIDAKGWTQWRQYFQEHGC